MKKITIYVSPSELAYIRGTPLAKIFEGLRQHTIPYQITDEGIKIPLTYIFSTTNDTTCDT